MSSLNTFTCSIPDPYTRLDSAAPLGELEFDPGETGYFAHQGRLERPATIRVVLTDFTSRFREALNGRAQYGINTAIRVHVAFNQTLFIATNCVITDIVGLTGGAGEPLSIALTCPAGSVDQLR